MLTMLIERMLDTGRKGPAPVNERILNDHDKHSKNRWQAASRRLKPDAIARAIANAIVNANARVPLIAMQQFQLIKFLQIHAVSTRRIDCRQAGWR
jgi:hypothetical protein